MRFTTLYFGVLPALLHIVSVAFAQGNCQVMDGNQYCQPVNRAIFQGVGGSGSYQRVTYMNSETGEIDHETQTYSGPLAPFDEDLTVHFRGPINLKQFAVYIPGQVNSKREVREEVVEKRDVKYVTEVEVVDIWEKVVVEGVLGGEISTHTEWSTSTEGSSGQTSTVKATFQAEESNILAAVASPKPTTLSTVAVSSSIQTSSLSTSAVKPSRVSSNPSNAPSSSSSDGSWQQIGYYNSDSQTANGITFLNNRGGQGSGVWSPTFGNSLSYASTDSSTGASSAQLFSGTLSNDTELAIFSNQSCNTAACGYSQPGGVNYYGFAGASKLFLFEFEMPGSAGKPAIWFLNGQIPRIGQYLAGNCWPGCGEIDTFEILSQGFNQLIPTVHLTEGKGAGIADYFVRPESTVIKAAVLMNNNNIVIQTLSPDYNFVNVLTSDDIDNIESNANYPENNMASIKVAT
jgi:hypothetical protein